MVITKDSLLDVLCDGVLFFLRGNLHFSFGHLRDLDNHVVGSFGGSLERDVMPRGDGLLGFGVLESQSERFGTGLSRSFQGVDSHTKAGGESIVGCKRGKGRCVSSRKGKDGKDGGLELHLVFLSVIELVQVVRGG